MDIPAPGVQDVKHFVGARDLDASSRFYEALGWRRRYDSADLRILELGGFRFYLQRYYVREWCDNTMIHVMVDDVEAWYRHVQKVFADHSFEGQARIGDPPRDEGYAVVFHVWDPVGVLLHFAQESP